MKWSAHSKATANHFACSFRPRRVRVNRAPNAEDTSSSRRPCACVPTSDSPFAFVDPALCAGNVNAFGKRRCSMFFCCTGSRFLTMCSPGKSFLLETLYIWCLVHKHSPQAAAPTGIAAARIHVPRTPVHAHTLHNLFALTVAGRLCETAGC